MTRISRTLRRLSTVLNLLAISLAELALVALMLITVYAVVARYVFRSPSIYAMEISTYLLLIVAWCAVGWTHHVRRHISVEAFVVMMRPSWQRICELVSQIVVLVFCSVIFWAGSKIVLTAIERNYRSASLLKFPLWIAYLLIPLGVLLLAFAALSRFKEMEGDLDPEQVGGQSPDVRRIDED